MSLFDSLVLLPPDPIFGISATYRADKREKKIDLVVGSFRTEEGETPVLQAVKRAEQQLLHKERDKEYLPIDGEETFISEIAELLFGDRLMKEHLYGAQTVGGTGALRTIADILFKKWTEVIYTPNLTWPNHRGIFTRVGYKVENYPYYDTQSHSFDFDNFYDFIEKLPNRSLIVLHASCHNPTGADLKPEEWRKLSELFLIKGHFPFFDCAYQGFGKSLIDDVYSVRLFAEAGHEMAVAYSCAKNFSLYGERVGALYFLVRSKTNAETIRSYAKALIRTNYSNPPMHGAKIVAEILSSSNLTELWEEELSVMRARIAHMRKSLLNALQAKSKKMDFSFLNEQLGLFSFFSLEKSQVERLISEFGIYMPYDGRINVTGLNEKNLDPVVKALLKVIE